MKITGLGTVIKNIDGEGYQDNGKPLTLKRTMLNALGSGVPSDQQAQAKDKEHCYDLFLSVQQSNGEIEIESEDASLIKSRISQLYPPIIVGQAVRLIEGKGEAGKSKGQSS